MEKPEFAEEEIGALRELLGKPRVEGRGKYWKEDPERLAKAEAKRERRRYRNLRNTMVPVKY